MPSRSRSRTISTSPSPATISRLLTLTCCVHKPAVPSAAWQQDWFRELPAVGSAALALAHPAEAREELRAAPAVPAAAPPVSSNLPLAQVRQSILTTRC